MYTKEKKKQYILTFRTNKEINDKLEELIEFYELKNGIRYSKSEYINYLIEQALKDNKITLHNINYSVYIVYKMKVRKNIILEESLINKLNELKQIELFENLSHSQIISKLINMSYKKNKKEIEEMKLQKAFEEEGLPSPKNKWERNINATIELAKMDWLNNN